MDLMAALSGIYEILSVNNKVHLIKRLFNLKILLGIDSVSVIEE